MKKILRIIVVTVSFALLLILNIVLGTTTEFSKIKLPTDAHTSETTRAIKLKTKTSCLLAWPCAEQEIVSVKRERLQQKHKLNYWILSTTCLIYFLASVGLAYLLSSIASRIPVVKIALSSSVLALILGPLIGVQISRYLWNYDFTPPDLPAPFRQATLVKRVLSVTSVPKENDWELKIREDDSLQKVLTFYESYPNKLRMFKPLAYLNRQKLLPQGFSMNKRTEWKIVNAINQLIKEKQLLLRGDQNYRTATMLNGTVVQFESDSSEYILLSAMSGQVSKQRYANYQILFRPAKPDWQVVSSEHFLNASGQLNQLKWPILHVLCSILVLTLVAVLFSLSALIFVQTRVSTEKA